MILRSLMFVPGHNRHYLEQAAATDADGLIVDLEDSVPASAKNNARIIGRQAIEAGIFRRQSVFIRTNDFDSGLLEPDLWAFSSLPVEGFILPKVMTAAEVRRLDFLLDRIEESRGIAAKRLSIIPLIETCSAVLHALDIATASPRVVAIAFGCEDFIADLQGVHDEEMVSLSTPRAMIAMAARTAGVIPIDTVHVRVHDLDDLEQNLARARILGFEGTLLLHPKEIPAAHRHFTPSEEEYRNAREVVRLTDLAMNEGRGVAWVDGRFLGPPMVRAAKNLVRRAEAIRRWEQDRG